MSAPAHYRVGFAMLLVGVAGLVGIAMLRAPSDELASRPLVFFAAACAVAATIGLALMLTAAMEVLTR